MSDRDHMASLNGLLASAKASAAYLPFVEDLGWILADHTRLREQRDKLAAALDEIADAKQVWSNGGSYAGGETNAGFAGRLQAVARTVLAEVKGS